MNVRVAALAIRRMVQRAMAQSPWAGASPSRRIVVAYLSACVAVAVSTGIIALLRLPLPRAHLVILYLLPVLALASIWGRGPALAAAVLSVLAYDFAFVEPVFTLTIRDPDEWLALLVFLVTALVGGQFAASLRRRAEEARARATTLATLHRLTQALIADRDPEGLLALIAEQVVATFEVRECAILLPDSAGRLRLRARAPAEAVEPGNQDDEVIPAAQAFAQPDVAPTRHGAIVFVPLQAGARRVGLMRVAHTDDAAPDEERRRLLSAFAAGAALAIERGLLAEATVQAAVLARSDALKSTLLASVSHELRTPLAAIKGSVSSLLEEEAEIRWDPVVRREFLLTIDEETDRLTQLIGNLLDLSRIEAGVLRPRREPYALDELLWGVIDQLPPATAARVRLQLPADLPLVPLDPVLMERVVGNLLENAAKYAPPGSPIDLLVARRGDTVEIAVADRGPGIPPAEREHIFERFYRADPTRAVKGVGLGLAISRSFVEAHGGRIQAKEAPGGGACFVVALPLPAFAAPRAIDAGQPV